MIDILQQLDAFLQQISDTTGETPYKSVLQETRQYLADPELEPLLQEKNKRKLSYAQTAVYDDLLRFRSRKILQRILYHIYHLDVYITGRKTGCEERICFS